MVFPIVINVFKFIVVAALIVLLVVRYRSRVAAAASAQNSAAATSARTGVADLRSRLTGFSLRRRDVATEVSSRTERVRPRHHVPLPDELPVARTEGADAFDVSEDPAATPDPAQAAEPTTPRVAAEAPTQVLDALIVTSGWPTPDATAPADVSDEGAANIGGPGHPPSPPGWAMPSIGNDSADIEPVDPTVDPIASEWARVDASETGMDDAVLAAILPIDPASGATSWEDVAGFDPASGWGSDRPDDIPAGATWGTGPDDARAEVELPETPEWNSDPWTPPEVSSDDPSLEDAVPTWDVADWTPATSADEAPEIHSAVAQDSAVIESPEPLQQSVAPESTADEATQPEPATEVLDVTAPNAPIEVAPRAAADADASPPPVIVADPPAEADPVVTIDVTDWTPGDGVEPEPDTAPEPATEAPLIVHLRSGADEMKIVVERDQLGAPIAWVLSDSPTFDTRDPNVRASIVTPDEERTLPADSASSVESAPVPAAAADAVAPLITALAERLAEIAPPSTSAAKTRRKSARRRALEGIGAGTASRVSFDADDSARTAPAAADVSTNPTRTDHDSAATVAPEPTADPSKASKQSKKSKPSKRSKASKKTRRDGDDSSVIASEPVAATPPRGAADWTDDAAAIALLVQQEANRRFAEVLAQHGAVTANGDFPSLVDRLEQVAEAPATRSNA